MKSVTRMPVMTEDELRMHLLPELFNAAVTGVRSSRYPTA